MGDAAHRWRNIWPGAPQRCGAGRRHHAGQNAGTCDGDAQQAFALYESVRIPRTARIVWSTREMGRLYHAAEVERQVRNLLWKGNRGRRFIAVTEWLYGWKEDNCLEPR